MAKSTSVFDGNASPWIRLVVSIFRTLHRSILVLFAIVVISIVTLVHFSITKIVAEQSRAQQESMSPAIDLVIDQMFKPLHIAETLSKSRELIDLMDIEEGGELDRNQALAMLQRLEQEFGMIFFIRKFIIRIIHIFRISFILRIHYSSVKMALLFYLL